MFVMRVIFNVSVLCSRFRDVAAGGTYGYHWALNSELLHELMPDIVKIFFCRGLTVTCNI